jgi:ectoine hydroxylase-related dioxygenase (phytanoyl-CoA dioxygenase family)
MKYEPEKWKAEYERDGYLMVPEVLDPSTLARLREAVEKITADPDGLPLHLKRHVQMERDYVQEPGQRKYNDLNAAEVGNAVRNIMELPLFSPFLAHIIMHKPLLDILETLFESPEFHFHNYKCIIKAPKVSSAFRWHRDLPYLKHTTPNLITAMLCLDPMTRENGATVVLPGTHRIPEDQFKESDVEIQEDRLPREARQVTVECPAGSAVLFHVNIIHGGGPNRSESPRRNIIGIWAGPDTYPTTASRYAYGEVYPRSQDPAKRLQVEKTFGKA